MSRPRSTASRGSTRACSTRWRRRAFRSKRRVVPRLGAALATIDQHVVLVLDDLHLIDNPACLDAVAALARHVPEGSQLVLSARGEPAFPLGALRARGLAIEIGPDDLRMDEAEADQLLGAAGVDLPGEQIAELTEHTEGWSAGLYLAALSIKARGRAQAQRRGHVLRERPARVRLPAVGVARAPVPGRASLPDADRCSGAAVGPALRRGARTSGSAELLESLARSNLFLVPLDANGEWYRYHHLFQELLRAELPRAEPELVPRLFARASDMVRGERSSRRRRSATRSKPATSTASRGWSSVGLNRSTRAAASPRPSAGSTGWSEHGALDRNAAVAVLGALIAAVQGRPAEAERWAEMAECASYDGVLYDGSASIDSWLALLRAIRCGRGVAMMREDAELAVRTLARGSPFWPTALLLVALSHQLAGELDRADDLFADVAEEGVELGAPEAVAVALGERSALAIGRGAWTQAEELADRALRLVRRSRMEEYPTSALAYALAARVALHRGEAERAQDFLGRAQRFGQDSPTHCRTWRSRPAWSSPSPT